MDGALAVYRDDGAVARALGAAVARFRLPAAGGTVLGAVCLLVGAAIDGRVTSVATVAGWTAFAVCAASAAAAAGAGRWDWVMPPLLRLAEYGLVACLAWRAGAAAGAFALLAVTAFHHYDAMYRLEHQGAAPPRWLFVAGLGWEGRTTVLLAATLAGLFPETVIALVGWCAVLFVSESVRSWTRHAQRNRRSAPPTTRTEGTP